MNKFSSVAQSYLTLCDPMYRSRPDLPVRHQFQSPPKPLSIESMMPSNHLILCRHLLLLPSIFPSVRVFSNESALRMRWPKYWSFGFSIIPSKEIPSEWTGWISFQSKDFQESSPTPQFKSINSSALSLLHSPTLTSIHDHRENHSLD